MENNDRLQYLLQRLAGHTATDAELDELAALVGRDEPGAGIEEAERRLEDLQPDVQASYDHQHWMRVADGILGADKLRPAPETVAVRTVHPLQRWWWAAAAVLIAAAGIWLLNRPAPRGETVIANVFPQDVEPGKNGAVLTLADGSQLALDSAGNGVITRQNGTTVTLQDGALQYEPEDRSESGVKYNTIATSNGRQFTVTLPDGTKVWLNAGSYLRFPVAFSGADRQVEFSGEGWFEVAKDVKKPFRVKVPGRIDLEVLGTSFNINAYANEPHSYTTLVTGAVRVALAGKPTGSVLLKPGEQLQADGSGMDVMRNANVDKAIAWKNGLFNFDGVELREMMRQLARWYDLEVVYEGNVPEVVFFGEMSRKLKLSDVLGGLERSNVHFRLEEGRRLVVMP
ncbi:FecR domain-containing protein [Chitinophaga pollutisoli]|uniref:FecR domain-containing protein n=1 Tax=Chitinophaga pollutisoli TaxID=3133966 RepID=A0ABZ2YSA6_9BACT